MPIARGRGRPDPVMSSVAVGADSGSGSIEAWMALGEACQNIATNIVLCEDGSRWWDGMPQRPGPQVSPTAIKRILLERIKAAVTCSSAAAQLASSRGGEAGADIHAAIAKSLGGVIMLIRCHSEDSKKTTDSWPQLTAWAMAERGLQSCAAALAAVARRLPLSAFNDEMVTRQQQPRR